MSNSVNSLGAAAAVVQERATAQRVVHWFDVPEGIAELTQIKKVGLVELTQGEEMMASRRIGTDMIRLAFELPKESLRYLDDTPINMGDLSAESFWASGRPGMSQLRTLITTAYGVIHNPTGDDTRSFLKSRRQNVR